jgi:hypothetical protein
MAIIKVKTGGITADAITDALIADDVVGTEHLTANEVDTAALGADAVTGAQLADDAVNSEHYTDGSIDTAHIADNQITLAKLAGGTDGNIISFDASGDPVAIATGSDGQVLTSTGAGSPPAFEAIPAGGITEFDMHRLTTQITANTDPITSGLERPDDATFSKIGTGVSQSSGVWSFPSTGLWQVGGAFQMLPDTNDTLVVNVSATADNGSNWDHVVQINNKSGSGAQSGAKSDGFTLVNCTDTSNVKVKFSCGSFDNSTSRIQANSDMNFTYFYFIRIGDSQ